MMEAFKRRGILKDHVWDAQRWWMAEFDELLKEGNFDIRKDLVELKEWLKRTKREWWKAEQKTEINYIHFSRPGDFHH